MKKRTSTTDFELAEEHIRAGNFAQARQILVKAQSSRLFGNNRVRFANLATRAGLPQLAVRALHRVLHPKTQGNTPPTDTEVCEYALGLSRLGATREAVELFNRINTDVTPQAMTYQATALFQLWRYEEAKPLLLKARNSSVLRPYERAVASTNLVAAHLALGEVHDAEQLIENLMDSAKAENWTLLQSNLLELRAQASYQKEDFDSALRHLKLATEGVKGLGTQDNLFVRKWRALIQLRGSGGKSGIDQVLAIRDQALSVGHWETVRDCDLNLGVIEGNAQLLGMVYWGTPFRSIRQKIRQEASSLFKPENSFHWAPPYKIFGAQKRYRRAGQLVRFSLEEWGALLFRVFITLSADFYRPFRTVSLADRIYANQFYHPDATPLRVRQLVNRFNQRAVEMGVPVSIRHFRAGYFLSAFPGTRIVIEPFKPDEVLGSWARLKKVSWDLPRSNREIAEVLGCSMRTAVRLTSDGVSKGYLEVMGSGPSTRYRRVSKLNSKV